ncbi:MAG: hypothetical protein GXO02_04490 [Epsilonproteobacteria bacterium]|nr:hypothetical protein [Campylobacterota bacterium]
MPIYSKVETIEDIARINCLIRDEMLKVEDEAHLSELKKRSDYLCTLTYSPFWQKKFQEKIEEVREIAIKENRITVQEANIISKYKGFNKEYHPWKKEIDVSIQLKEIPNEVMEEVFNSAISFEFSVEVLENIRELFCDIRKAMIVCEDEECLKRLKRGVDIISILPFLDQFSRHFEEDILKDIDSLINNEKSRSIELANIISEVNGWDLYFETLNVDNLNNKEVEEELDKLLKEEEKAQTYIPTEAKYKGGAKVLWIVYYHPKRKREYAKRVYIPSNFRDLKIGEVKEYENRFGNKVWGIEITYESLVEPTTIKVRGREIHLPQRWIKRKKVIPIPKIAQNIRVLEEKPESAMDIA